MHYLKIFIVTFCAAVICSCNGKPSSLSASSDKSSSASSEKSSDQSDQQLIDTNKLKTDMNNVMDAISTGKPDTNKLKKAASDILSTDATILSDSGIDKMYGNSNDPAVNEAKNALIKARNAMGMTPGKLDSLRKKASELAPDTSLHH
ncbi:MAG: hypothetical protein ACR2FN_09325 [Chitinophagaceae bacterium]